MKAPFSTENGCAESRRRILVWSINYAPEVTGIAPCNVALCEFLQGRGYETEMVTGFSYYPLWTKRPEDRGRIYRKDILNGVPVYRCWQYVPAKVKAWKRILHEATFVLTSSLRIVSRPRADVIVVVSPPLLLGAAAWIVSRLRRVPFLFHVQDLQPDAAIGLGMLKEGMVARVLYGLETLAYRKAACISGITRGMLNAFTRKGVPVEKQRYLPNGVTLPASEDFPPKGRFRARLGIPEATLLAVYSGNLGVKQGLSALLDAMATCSQPDLQVVICGDGAERHLLADRIAKDGLRNVHLLPLQPRPQYEEMLVDADICLITQMAGSGQFFFPSKLLTTLAFGKPILAVADDDSELAVALQEGGFGLCVPTGDPLAIARALQTVAVNRDELKQMGLRGRIYVEQFEAERTLREFETVLCEIIQPAEREILKQQLPAKESIPS